MARVRTEFLVFKWYPPEAKVGESGGEPTTLETRKGDILLFCGSWASEGSQPEFQAHAERGRHPRETHLADGSSCGSWHSPMLP
jgi:hypothetical protein